MTVYEFGKENAQVIVLIHPSLVMWDYFEYVIPLMQDRYHLVIPALPGYDTEEAGDFTSVEEIAAELAEWLIRQGYTDIACMYGCSMGGSIVTRFLADRRVRVRCAVLDGAITPYRLPWIVTRLIAARDFLMVYTGKLGGIRLLEKAFTSDEYSEEDLDYIGKVLQFISARTIWRTFDSCNNYPMPEKICTNCPHIEYWYAKTEENACKWDIGYIRRQLPDTVFRMFEDIGHGGLAVLRPELLVTQLEKAMGE